MTVAKPLLASQMLVMGAPGTFSGVSGVVPQQGTADKVEA